MKDNYLMPLSHYRQYTLPKFEVLLSRETTFQDISYLPIFHVGSRIVIFASEECLQLLSRSKTWYMDGNFKMSPKLFMQLYVIRVPLGETAVSVVYILLQRVPAPFPPQVWNVHEATLTGNARTNNLCEGWNTRFQSLVGHHHPSTWKLIIALQQENATVSISIAQERMGNPPNKHTHQVYINLQQHLQRLVIAYDEGNKDMVDFLEGVGKNLQKTQIDNMKLCFLSDFSAQLL